MTMSFAYKIGINNARCGGFACELGINNARCSGFAYKMCFMKNNGCYISFSDISYPSFQFCDSRSASEWYLTISGGYSQGSFSRRKCTI